MNTEQKHYIDENNYSYVRAEVLASGGQGVVYRTNYPGLLIKFATNENGQIQKKDTEVQAFKDKIKRIMYLPILNKQNIALPHVLLKDHAGYVMKLFDDMIPIQLIMAGDYFVHDALPDWLAGVPEQSGKAIHNYLNSGGLRRRLIILAKTAQILTDIHQSGMIYGDLSPQNVFVSEAVTFDAVNLIDSDNMTYAKPGCMDSVYTPGYGAPEIVQGTSGTTQQSDTYAFAILAFKTLAMLHPFEGQLVDGTGDTDWAEDDLDEMTKDEQAYAGLLPFVDDLEDDSNCSSNGLPRMLVTTDKIRTLFQKTFTEGRIHPLKRPSILHWSTELIKAADQTLLCSYCGMSYFHDFVSGVCPYCQSELPKHLLMTVYEKQKGMKAVWTYAREISDTGVIDCPNRLFQTQGHQIEYQTALTFKIKGDHIEIQKHDYKVSISVAVHQEPLKFKAITTKIEIPIHSDSDFYLWIKNENRVITCQIKGV